MKEYLIIDKKVLPDYFEKVLKAKTMISEHICKDVSEACRVCDISRSTYYKYKDNVFRLASTSITSKAELNLILEHKSGVLSNVLACVSNNNCNIITINQNAPLNNTATLSLLIDISHIKNDLDRLICELEKVRYVINVKLVSIE